MISQYLLDNYYVHCKDRSLVPTSDQITQAISKHPEKMIVIKRKKILGIAFFLTLTDETYKRLELMDIKRMEVLQALVLENGRNIHFVILTADSFKTIRIGLRRLVKSLKPKTVSWWNPEFTKLHKYEVK